MGASPPGSTQTSSAALTTAPPLPDRSTARRSIVGVLAALVSKGAGAGFVFVSNVLLVRLLGAAGTGVYFLAITIVAIGSTIARLGLDHAVLRFASVAHADNDDGAMAALYRRSLSIIVAAGLTVTLFGWLVAPYLPLGGDRSDDLQMILPIMLLAVIPNAINIVQGQFFKAIRAPGLATILQATTTPVLLTIGALLLLWRGHATLHEVVALYLGSMVLALGISVAAWYRRVGNLWRKAGSFDTNLLVRTSLPLFWVAALNLVMSGTDILVLGAWETASTVGIYGAAVRLAGATAFILLSVNAVVAPRFAAIYARGDRPGLQRLAQQAALGTLGAALPIVVALLSFPEWFLQFFGHDFSTGANQLRVLTVAQLINAATGSVGCLLMMTGRQTMLRNTIMMTAVANLTGNLLLVPKFGAIGAAWSTTLSTMLLNIVCYVFLKRAVGVDTFGYLRKPRARRGRNST